MSHRRRTAPPRHAEPRGTPADDVRAAVLAGVQVRVGHAFTDPGLLDRALTHRSYVNEHPKSALEHNERLEFLGDAVLDFLVAERVMVLAPAAREGDLTRMRAAVVNEVLLSRLARRKDLGSALRLGKGEQSTGGREKPSLLADAYEAVVAAVYLDGGLDAARRLVRRHLGAQLRRICAEGAAHTDPKTVLQEHLQNTHRRPPQYVTVAEEGPAHSRTFVVEIRMNGERLGRGRGSTKKDAEQRAARMALRRLGVWPSAGARAAAGAAAGSSGSSGTGPSGAGTGGAAGGGGAGP